MTSKRLFFILTSVVCLLFAGLAGGAYGANQLLTKQADTLTGLKAQSKAQTLQSASLHKAKQDIHKYADLQKIAQTVVPEDKNQAEAVRQIVNIAEANGIQLASVTFPASTLGNSPTGKPLTTSPSAAADSTATRLSQLTPVKNIPGVYELPITIQNDTSSAVPYSKLIGFLNDLEHNRRTAQVSNIDLQPLSTNRNMLVFSLSLTEYIKP